MLDRILRFVSGAEDAPPPARPDELEDAVAALMIEAAHMDNEFGPEERAMMERLLGERFHLAEDEVQRLMMAAESAVGRSAQLHPFTQKIVRTLPPETRSGILEMLWKIAYADGVLDPHEDMLLRKVAGLIHVPDRERGLARQRALRKLKERGLLKGLD